MSVSDETTEQERPEEESTEQEGSDQDSPEQDSPEQDSPGQDSTDAEGSRQESAQEGTPRKRPARKRPPAKRTRAPKKAAAPAPAPARKKVPAMKVARMAAQQLAELTGRVPESVIGISRTEDGFRIELEVVESRRIPDSADILATYEVETDEDGDLVGYHRARRYLRGKGSDGDGR